MIIHHIVAILGFQLSYLTNFVRMGTLGILCHDLGDVFIDGWKLLTYDKSKSAITNVIFVAFLFCWVATRLVYFPFVCIRSLIFDAPSQIHLNYNILDPFQAPFAPRIILFLSLCLLSLHIFWTVLIVKMIYRMSISGDATDVRTDSDDEDENEDEVEKNDYTKK
ncbi:hypothetical protein PMAYCL1PPCAC_16540, partial [Pristionchus mayeri]